MFTKIVIFIVVVLFPIISSGQDIRLQKVAILRKDIAVEMQYLIAVPQEEPAAEGWPLLLFLHGLGECGSDINSVKNTAHQSLLKMGRNFLLWSCPHSVHGEVVGSPGNLLCYWMMLSKHDIDEGRIYLTG